MPSNNEKIGIFMKDVALMQENYDNLRNSGNFTKQAICNMLIPFRDKYKLTDIQTLGIANKRYNLAEMIQLTGLDS